MNPIRKNKTFLIKFCFALLVIGVFVYLFSKVSLEKLPHKEGSIDKYTMYPLVPTEEFKFKTFEEAKEARQKLIELIWKNENNMGISPFKVNKRVWDYTRDEKVHNKLMQVTSDYLSHVDQLEISIAYGYTTHVNIYYPKNLNEYRDTLILYNQGHDVTDSLRTVDEVGLFIERGFVVAVTTMPVQGNSYIEDVMPVKIGSKVTKQKYRINTHDDFMVLDDAEINPLIFFVEPIVVATNYAKEQGYSNIIIGGISGGAWSAMLAAAIDPEIDFTFATAGPLPPFLEEPAAGDFEFNYSKLNNTLTYLEMYSLASLEHGRRVVQIFNKHDACCSRVVTRHLGYERLLNNFLSINGGGSFEVYIDEQETKHAMSENTIDLVLDSFLKDIPIYDGSSSEQELNLPTVLNGMQVIYQDKKDVIDLSRLNIEILNVNSYMSSYVDHNTLGVMVRFINDNSAKKDLPMYSANILMSYVDADYNLNFVTNYNKSLDYTVLEDGESIEYELLYKLPREARFHKLYFFTAADTRVTIVSL